MANKPILRDAKNQTIVAGSGALNPGGRPRENWRGWLRRETQNGAEIHKILLDLARGNPRIVKLLDGRESVIIPTPEVQARVAIHLDEMMHGKAVTQNEQQKAEREAGALAAVQALSDTALEERVRLALARRASTLGPGISEGEIVDPEPNAAIVKDVGVGGRMYVNESYALRVWSQESEEG